MKSSSNVLKPDQVAFRVAAIHKEPRNPAGAPSSPRSAPKQLIDKEIGLKRAELLSRAKLEAQRIIDQAQVVADQRLMELQAREEQADAVLEKARREGMDLGKEEGFALGYEAGRQEGMEALKALVQDFQSIVDQAQQAHQTMLAEAEADLVKLAVALAEKILCRELRLDAEFPASLLHSFVPSMEGNSLTSVRVAPQTLHTWRNNADPICERLEQQLNVSLVVDESLEPGDVVLETEWGFVDGRLKNRWRRILEGLNLLEDNDSGDVGQ